MMVFDIKQENFEGPLDLLLELIEKEELSISQISLAKVADDYIRYIKSLEKMDPEQLAEFLVVAAHLMLVKSRTLLPNLELSAEEEGSIEDLEKRLAEYKLMKDFGRGLKELANENKYIFGREAYLGLEPVFYPPPKLKVAILQKLFMNLVEALPKLEKLAEEKLRRIISLEERISHIRYFLQNVAEKAFSELVRGAKEKTEVIVSFLAILELAKQKFVELEQKNPFADITVKRTIS